MNKQSIKASPSRQIHYSFFVNGRVCALGVFAFFNRDTKACVLFCSQAHKTGNASHFLKSSGKASGLFFLSAVLIFSRIYFFAKIPHCITTSLIGNRHGYFSKINRFLTIGKTS